ncbi:MAG: hypothetical protein IJX40_00375 [Alistipes sp.]|nr:hypothetical protein [Alistipes sp.]
MSRIVAIIGVLLLVGCYNSADKPRITPDMPVPTMTIARLHDVVGSGGIVLDGDYIVEGRVVSSDVDENFYRTLIVEDGGAAVEVMAGMPRLMAEYPVGLKVALCLDGCYADYGYGVLQVGCRGTGGYAVDYLASPEALDRVIVRSTDVAEVEPAVVTLANLNMDMCGRLVRVESLRLVAASSVDERDSTLSNARWAGYTLFKDERGDSIALYTRDYAAFADRVVPHDEVTITGIVQWGEYDGGAECYQLKMRYAEDCVVR